jgi:ABC-type nickel/cobalt efflux system permease component RcnA
VGDPEYYVAFSLPSFDAVRLVNAPPACKLRVHPGEEPDAAAAAQLAEIGPDQRELPAGMQALAAGTANTAEVNCAPGAPPASAEAAAAAMAGTGNQSGDLTALPAGPGGSQAENAVPQESIAAPPAPESPGLFRRWTAWIGQMQAQFSRELTSSLGEIKSGSAFWWLAGISFLYGIVHAAGPGHGKVVISSYLLANEARVRRGVAVAFIAAFVQAAVAVGIIGVMAALLNMTSMAIQSTAKVFEAGSFALVAALGLYLLARKGRAALSVMNGGDPHADHHHHHEHHHHAHAHAPLHACGAEARGEECRSGLHASPLPDPPPQGGRGMAGAAAAILSVGIRPCTGALIVLVLALSQGIFWAGVASTFVMALGTAIAVAVLAALAVGAKDVAVRLTQGDGRRAAHVMLGLELVAAVLLTVLGAALFAGSVYA